GRANFTPAAFRGSKERRGRGGSLFHSALVWIGGERDSPRAAGPEGRGDRPDLPAHITAPLSGMAQFVRPRGTIKEVPDFGSPPVNLGFVACCIIAVCVFTTPRRRYIFGGDDVDLTRKVEMEHSGRHPRRRVARGNRRYLVALVNVDHKQTVKN